MTAAMRAFLWFRDIPYSLDADREDKGYFSYIKMKYLQEVLQQLGYKTRMRFGRFDWRKQPIPEEILAFYKPSVFAFHAFLEFSLDEGRTWHVVDPTFDEPLRMAGLPVAEWDGQTSTVLAIADMEILSAEDGTTFVENLVKEGLLEQEFRSQRLFFKELKRWMCYVRRLHDNQPGEDLLRVTQAAA